MNSYTIYINVTAQANEYILVEMQEPIQDLSRVNTIKFNTSPDTNPLTEYRWSKDGETWAEWKSWPSPLIKDSEFTWLGFRMKSDAPLVVKSLDLEWEGGQLGEDGTCSCTVVGCGSESGDNSFLANCNTSYLYNTALSGISWWESLTCSVFANMGWPVIYFKCDEIEESRDVVFKEWSLLRVRECKKIKVVVPDNNFGGGEIQFTEYDADFSDEVEIQIHKESFWASFGNGEQPAEKDFLYFPLERRMYRVNSVQAHKGYMRQVAWWKALLIKWNESDSIYKSEEIQETIDDLTLNFDDVGFEDIKAAEEIDIVKPQQYTTRRIADSDNCRKTINIEWEKSTGIIERNLENYFTVFSKFQYNLKTNMVEEPLITYQNPVNTEDNFAIMYWHKMNPRTLASGTIDTYVKLFGGETEVSLAGNETRYTGLMIGNNEFIFDLPLSDWYATYIGYNKDCNELTLRIWKRLDNTSKTTKMDIIYESTVVPEEFGGDWNVELYGSGDEIASIRFLKEVMTLENQAPSFNKLVFREDSLGYIIDDAYPLSYLGYLSNR